MLKIKIKNLEIKKDERGWLSEILRAEDVRDKKFGQILITVAKPGQTKGNHYHKRKTEWYCVLAGKGLLTVINRKNKKRKEIKMGKDNMIFVEIPVNHHHWIKNVGKNEMMLLAYTDDVYDKNDPDTYEDASLQ